ncbi:hypothetical protein [Desulfofustis glycolicus]|uniref:Uncharacterized protein n=1 Tax=Desulfofustis glycolicus DSM 9705 TaxID=1121409 RepID=A0A1M5UJP0_9BACT|nr:hypothetical protein [Desulfofustis glycolicus]SHH63225.1 hypothetical protein SAMN02745124_01206 [Desulfofustis glycolicus DSM 9705]
MGGYGSGRRWNAKSAIERQSGLDIRLLKKDGCLREGFQGSISWGCNGSTTNSVNVRITNGSLVLDYKHRFRGGEWEPIKQTIQFAYTPCHYGGMRTWFSCPSCYRRVAVVYGAGKYFLCRHCHNLTYASQQEGRADRMLRKARKIRRRLGASINMTVPILFKPKGMHWITFMRCQEKVSHANYLFCLIEGKRLGIRL